MNKFRRKGIATVIASIEELKLQIEAIRDDEQEALDGMLESLQEGERGQASSDAISNLEDAISTLEETVSYLESASE